ncbi:MAG: hypothetical protein KDB22_11300 [Planctomycetales bacterium]|nr:hypothetical protein [Planctomycetales bacterium]
MIRQALSRLLEETSSHAQPKQVAFGVAVGILAAFCAKSPILAIAVVCAAYILPLHLPICLIVSIVALPLPSLIAAQAGTIGLWVLTQSPFASWLVWMDSFPIVPWLGLHNSVVCGDCIIGLAVSPASYMAICSVGSAIQPQSGLAQAEQIGLSGIVPNPSLATSIASVLHNDAPEFVELSLLTSAGTDSKKLAISDADRCTPERDWGVSEPRRSLAGGTAATSSKNRKLIAVDTAPAVLVTSTQERRLRSLLSQAESDDEYHPDATAVLSRANEMTEIIDSLLETIEFDTQAGAITQNEQPMPTRTIAEYSPLELESANGGEHKQDLQKLNNFHKLEDGLSFATDIPADLPVAPQLFSKTRSSHRPGAAADLDETENTNGVRASEPAQPPRGSVEPGVPRQPATAPRHTEHGITPTDVNRSVHVHKEHEPVQVGSLHRLLSCLKEAKEKAARKC